MRKTSPGVDRTEMVAMRKEVAALKVSLDKHTLVCYQCKHAGSDVYGHCVAWWAIARALHNSRRILNAREEPTTEGELFLPGMEDL